MEKITFLNPEFFWLFVLIPVVIVWFLRKKSHQSATLKMSSLEGFKGTESNLTKLKPILNVFRVLAL